MLLIFGGTGFIGKNICVHLHATGQAAQVVSRNPDRDFLAKYAPSISAVALDAFWQTPNDFLGAATTVVYAAATSTPGTNVETPWDELGETVEPVFRLAKAAAEVGARMIYLSSGGAIYGNTGGEAVKETRPMHPVSPYGLGKMQCEQALAYCQRAHGLRHVVLRPSNPVGPFQTNAQQGVIGVLLRKALTREAFTMFGDGSSVRDYLSVRDLVSALSLAIGTDRADGTVWNVGQGKGWSTAEIHQLACEITGIDIPMIHQAARKSDVDHLVLDVQKIGEDLGWRPVVALEDEITRSWETLREQ